MMVSNRETVINSATQRERELVGLFGFYVERLNTGEEIHPQEILARHPELGADLLECLEGYIDPDAAPSMPSDRTLGGYTLRREIGRGGMGVVYDAWQNSLDRRVALKILPIGLAASDGAFDRFMREARTAAKLDHQNIVRVYGMGVEANTPYYSMEHVEGRTLAQIIALIDLPEMDIDAVAGTPFELTKEGGADYSKIALTFAEVADGLEHAHSRRVIHRDIKPSNLILDSQGHLRILDFGLARFEGDQSLTLTGDLLGTPMYMSPEQARRRQIPIDHRTDIYSLGATLYEVLTHRPPFQGEDHRDTLSQIIEQDPQPARRVDAAIPRDFETIVLKCLRKDPRDRYQTAEALAADLRSFASGDPIEARPLPRWRSTVRWFKRRAIRIGVVVMTLALLSIVIQLVLQPQDMVNRRILTTRDMEMNNFLDMRPSPDSRFIAFSRIGSDGALIVRNLETGEMTQLTTGDFTFSGEDGPVWSPDGRRIAYSIAEPKALQIVDVASRESVVPKGTEGLELWPLDWSPDGTTLLCGRILDETTKSLVSISLDSGAMTTLVNEGLRNTSSAAFSRDGRYIAYSAVENGNQDVFVIATDGSNKQRISDAPSADRHPLWSPDGKVLLYTNQDEWWSARVVDGRLQETVSFLRAQTHGRPLAWNRDGKIFCRSFESIMTFSTVPVDPESGAVTGTPGSFTGITSRHVNRGVWSPDMKQFAYTTYDDGDIHIYSATDRSRRTFASGFERFPANFWWSVDGEQLLFVSRGSLKTIIALNTTSGETKPLFQPLHDVERLHLRPDGKEIVFFRWTDGLRNSGKRELVVAEIGQRQGRVLADERDEAVGRFSNWVRLAFSPDGTQVLFATNSGSLWIANTDGSGRRIIATADEVEYELATRRFVHGAVWHPSGKFIVYDNWRDLFMVNVETGEQQTHEYLDESGESINILSQWSPDGTNIVISSGRGGGPELWVVRNLLDAEAAEN